MEKIEDHNTVKEARDYLIKGLHDGVECPVCCQHAQIYRYKLYATSAQALIRLYALTQTFPSVVYWHISNYAEAATDRPRAPHFAELRFWGLIARRENPKPGQNSAGYWCITEKGKAFVRGEISLHSRILVFNNTFQGFEDNSESISIRDALQNKFNYQELMGDHYGDEGIQQRMAL